MRKKEYPDVHAGQVWVDRDARMSNRRVQQRGQLPLKVDK